MEDNGDLRRNRAMPAGERSAAVFFFFPFFFKETSPRMGFSRDVREWEAVIVCTHYDNANAPHVRTLHICSDDRKIDSIPAAWCTLAFNVHHLVAQSTIGLSFVFYSKPLYRNSTNRCRVSYAFSILQ